MFLKPGAHHFHINLFIAQLAMAESLTQFTTEQTDPLVFLNLGYPLTVEIEGKEWPTSEHYYLAMKFPEEEQQEKIRTARLEDARLMAYHSIQGLLDEDAVDSVLMKTLRAKFQQYPNLSRNLREIRNHVIEFKDKDPFLGNGDGTGKFGQNKLGILLAFMRREINENPSKYLEEGSDSESDCEMESLSQHVPPTSDLLLSTPPLQQDTFPPPNPPMEGYMGSLFDHPIGMGFHNLPPLPENYFKPQTTAGILSDLPPFSNNRIKHTSIL